MSNLWDETVVAITNSNHSLSDIDWIGGSDCYIDIHDFKDIAKHTYYDAGFGGQEVASDLVVVFKDGNWLARAEYDGSEWWQYYSLPQKPVKKIVPERLSCWWGGLLSKIQTLDEDGYPIDD